jgi:hypothetical protein
LKYFKLVYSNPEVKIFEVDFWRKNKKRKNLL